MRVLGFVNMGLIGLVASALGTGCSSDVQTGSGGAGGTGTSAAVTNVTSSKSSSVSVVASSSSTGGLPVCVGTTDTVFAVDEIFFGDTDFNGAASPTAWQAYGFNLDGLISTAASTDLCQPASGASKAVVYPDGNNGIDNAFGKSIVPLLTQLNPAFAMQGNAQIVSGDATLLIKLDGLLAGADQTGLVAKIYAGAAIGAAPKFDGTDCWPVTPSSLTSVANFESAKLQFPATTLAANHLDSNGSLTLVFPVSLMGYTLNLNIHEAQITMDLDAAHQKVVTGQIGGYVDTVELQNQVKQLAGSISPALCTSALVQGFLAQIAQASDIMNDGTQNAASTCNAVSIGVGFKASRVQFGALGVDPPAPGSPCP